MLFFLEYGECGVGAFCLGGCDPTMSFSLDACLPAPVCKDKEYKFDSLDRVADIGSYLGDPSKADWVASGEPARNGDNMLLTMPKGSVGTVVSSTNYMWYGNVKARLRTSRGRGVVSAFILFSDVQDEIDYEWVGVDLETSQTNWYFHGVPNYENSENITVTDSFKNFHDYELRWTPEKVEWWIDGEKGRTQERKDTWNKTTNRYEFPQTPARVQLSLWPGGLEKNPKGTVDWAGGLIDWEHEDIKKTGFFYVEVESVKVECYDGKDGIGTNSGKSYWYDDIAGTNDTVVDGDRDTKIASLQATGLDKNKGKKKDDKKDKDDDKDDDDEEDEVKTVPGGTSGSPGQDHSNEDEESSGGNGSSGGTEPADNYDWRKFDQGVDNKDGGGSGDGDNSGTKSGASALAMIVASCALYWL